jgi:enoyl-CoA hydratase/carnithine racemase
VVANTGFQLQVFQRATKGHKIADDRLGRRAPDLPSIFNQNGPEDSGYENNHVTHRLLLGHLGRSNGLFVPLNFECDHSRLQTYYKSDFRSESDMRRDRSGLRVLGVPAVPRITTSAANGSLVNSLPAGPTGFHPWVDIVVRLGKLPAVTISAIRRRARGAGSELILASDIRFASRERAVLGQMEVGFGAIPGGGPASLLPRLVGRGRAFEILLGGEDFNGELAERYGYVNRAIPDTEFESFVDRFARRVSTFDRQALADIKHFVNKVSLPAEEEFPPQIDAFWRAAARPAFEARFFDQPFRSRRHCTSQAACEGC